MEYRVVCYMKKLNSCVDRHLTALSLREHTLIHLCSSPQTKDVCREIRQTKIDCRPANFREVFIYILLRFKHTLNLFVLFTDKEVV